MKSRASTLQPASAKEDEITKKLSDIKELQQQAGTIQDSPLEKKPRPRRARAPADQAGVESGSPTPREASYAQKSEVSRETVEPSSTPERRTASAEAQRTPEPVSSGAPRHAFRDRRMAKSVALIMLFSALGLGRSG
jgi:hypothetical protein